MNNRALFLRMLQHAMKIALLAVVWFVACTAKDDGRQREEGSTGGGAPDASAMLATDVLRAGPARDLGSAMKRTSVAFHTLEDRNVASGTAHAISSVNGSLQVRAFHHRDKLGTTVRTAQARTAILELETSSVELGGTPLELSVPTELRDAEGRLVLNRGPVVEYIDNHDDHFEQSWRFAKRPESKGSLTVAIRAGGVQFVESTATGLHFIDATTGVGFRYSHATWKPSTGQEVAVPARWESGRIVLEVPETVLQNSGFPAVLDPIIGPEVGTDVPILGPSFGAKGRPRVASNGTNRLVVWEDDRLNVNGPITSVFGARVDIANAPLDPAGILISGGEGNAYDPDVAWSGTTFLVVWRQVAGGSQIRTARVSAAGTVIDVGGSVLQSDTEHLAPVVAPNGAGAFVVAWGAGSLFKSLYTTVIDANNARGSGDYSVEFKQGLGVPDIELGSSTLLVTWRDSRLGNYDVFSRIIDPSGQPLGTVTVLANQTFAEDVPRVSWNGSTFLVVWEAWAPYTEIRGKRVDGAGVVVDPSDVVLMGAPLIPFTLPSVGYNGSNWVVVARHPGVAATAQLWDSSLVQNGSVVVANGDGGYSDVAGYLNGGGAPTALVAWVDTTNQTVNASAVDNAGGTSVPADLSESGAAQRIPDIAYASGTDTYLAVWWEDDPVAPGIFGLRFANNGTPIGGRFLISNAVAAGSPQVASDGTDWLVVYTGVLVGDDLLAKVVSSTGSVGPQKAISTGGGAERSPAVAFGATRYLVAWQDDITAPRSVFARAVDTTGNTIGASYQLTADQSDHPAIACIGDTCFVVYDAQNEATIYGNIFQVDILNAWGATLVATGPSLRNEPSIASDNDDTYFVTWTDYRSGGLDIYGVRCGGTGPTLESDYLVSITPPSRRSDVGFDGTQFQIVYDTHSSLGGDINSTSYFVNGTPGGVELAVSADPQPETFPATAWGSNHSGLVAYAAYEPGGTSGALRTRVRYVTLGYSDGVACAQDTDCYSGFCADGVCCDAACGGSDANDCQACSVAAGAPADGICSTLADGHACDDADVCTTQNACISGVCQSGCQVRMFQTSDTPAGNFGGAGDADVICQTAANAGFLGGTWRAWISDLEDQGPNLRLVHAGVPYVRIDYVQVAADWADLTDGSIDAPISIDESYTYRPSEFVWTGTSSSGTLLSPTCLNWSDGTSAQQGTIGWNQDTGPGWTAFDIENCNAPRSLYCVEVGGFNCNPTQIPCDDFDVCTSDFCDPDLGCQHLALADGTPCPDGDLCNGTETCNNGACTPSGPLDCDDVNPCTSDWCCDGECGQFGCNNDPEPPSTQCGVQSCTGGFETPAAFCDGAGSCAPQSPISCGSYACDPSGTFCQLFCDDDSDCVPTYHCNTGTGTCQADMSLGSSCASGSECASGNCIDGFCCDSPCSGNCQSCSAANTGLLDGLCASVLSGQDPDGDCVQTPVSTCQEDGYCDGAGACRKYADGTSCGDFTVCNGIETCQAGTCAAGTPPDCDDLNECTDDTCDGESGCQHNDNSNSCDDGDPCTSFEACIFGSCTNGTPTDADGDFYGPLGCPGGTDCNDGDNAINPGATEICDAVDNNCAGGIDEGGVCLFGLGSGCVSGTECASTFCVDGRCCDTSCNGGIATDCVSCDVNGSLGTCTLLNSGPCDDGNVCTMTDTCSAGICTGVPKDTDFDTFVDQACGGTDCNDGLPSINPNATEICDGVDNNCAGGIDEGGVCLGGLGSPCASGTQCASTFCVDGVCCNNLCPGGVSDCQACNTGASPGTCAPLTGDPCDDGNACTLSDQCAAGACSPGPLPDVDNDTFFDAACGGLDCNDNNNLIFPGASETCDGCDQDCNGTVDDGAPGLACGFPSPPNCLGTQACIATSGQPAGTCLGGPSYGACSNTPQAEICDSQDNDCNGLMDDNLTDTGAPCGINIGACTFGSISCVGGTLVCTGGTSPTPEICDTIDNDCNGVPDDGVCGLPNGSACTIGPDCASTYCADGLCCNVDCASDPTDCQACSVAAGGTADGTCTFSVVGTVCHPSLGSCDVVETCNGASAFCPGDAVQPSSVECRVSAGECDPAEFCDGSAPTCPADSVQPVGTPCTSDGLQCTGDQCDGSGPTCTHPALSGPVCDDGLACTTGDACSAGICSGVATDGDGDTFLAVPCGGTDCDDLAPSVYLGAPEICDTLDNDCDSSIDEGGVCLGGLGSPCVSGTQCASTFCVDGVCCGDSCAGGVPTDCAACNVPGSEGTCTVAPLDIDLDTYIDSACGGTDCDDGNNNIHPGAFESCDGCDEDCDGMADNGAPSLACGIPVPANCQGTQACLTAFVGPGACGAGPLYGACSNTPTVEVCDSIDNDCNGTPDDGNPGGGAPCGSNVGVCTQGTDTCVGGIISCVGATGPFIETCDGLDNDCDGIADNGVSCGLPLGSLCSVGPDCASNFCADGRCCDTACGSSDPSDCQACSVAAGSAVDGTCAPVGAGTLCRGVADLCDVAEQCDGASAFCPVDAFVTAGTPCRTVAGECDVEETCSGGSALCPIDGVLGVGLPCSDEGNPCTFDGCDGITTTCLHSAVVDGSPCDDGSLCTGVDACSAGVCQPGTPVVCADPNPCTDDSCDPVLGCQNVFNIAPCDDGNACTQVDTCAAGACTGGGPVNCDDLNECTVDTCDPVIVCVNTPATDGTSCTPDGNICTYDTCQGGFCNSPVPGGTLECQAPSCSGVEPNALATLQEFCDGFGACPSSAPLSCGVEPCNATLTACQGGCGTDTDCPAGYFCGAGTCTPVLIAGSVCSRVAMCETGFCTDGFCCNSACPGPAGDCQSCGLPGLEGTCSAATGTACNDASACTTGDTCAAGTCTGTPVSCDDGNACTANTCSPGLGCQYPALVNGAACNDGSLCTTVDTCLSGVCSGATPLVCDDGDPCTIDGCGALVGCQTTPAANGVACTDNDACTTGDTCQAGVCQGGAPAVCNDSNACTNDSCSPATGCIFLNNTLPCDDANACTTGESCSAGACTGGTPIACDDGNACTLDACSPASGCTTSPLNGTACTDGDPCTAGDACVTGTCLPQGQTVCNDANPCTTDTCVAAQGGCVFANNTLPCNDGNACTTGEVCQAGACLGGTPTTCNDGNPCTTDTCAPATGCAYPNVVDDTSCTADGNVCTFDVCKAGQCNTAVPAGTVVCAAASCANGTELTEALCDGAGSCPSQTQIPCAPGQCDPTATFCEAGCSTDADCLTGYFCDTTGTCVADLALGQACITSSQCASGSCADGVCCDTACAGSCEACSAALTGGTSGTCAPVSAGTDPDSDCSDQGAASCGTTGDCDGSGSCRLYGAAAACAPDYCSGGSVMESSCDGSGACAVAPGAACGPFACKAGKCNTTCATSSDCAATASCVGGTCQPKKGNGEACALPDECGSGSCADGVCCDAMCGGLCQACSAAKKGSGADGVCGPIARGVDPDAECRSEDAATCGKTGSCDGAGACELHAVGTVCEGATCATGTAERSEKTCDGVGHCLDRGTTLCEPYRCSGSACSDTCQSDADCVEGATCGGNGRCVVDPRLGVPCSSNADCDLGFCVDGVCCNETCGGTCMACNVTLKGGGLNGICGPVASSSDPGSECSGENPESCGQDGSCDGAGACRLYDADTVCARALCVGPATESVPDTCDGEGTCVESGARACNEGFACVGFQCRTQCSSDVDCTSTHHCVLGECIADSPIGAPCTESGHCQSNFCVDKVCCNRSCQGECEACTAGKKSVGADGICEPISAGGDPDNECAAGTDVCGAPGVCDGFGACREFAPQQQACGTTSCVAGSVTGAICDGAGSCVQGTTTCEPFLCAQSACGSGCASDADCSTDAFCTVAGTCAPKRGNGESCELTAECTSGFCVDGFCCDAACDGQCEACDLPSVPGRSAPGTCSAATGAPHGSRPSCAGVGTLCAGSCGGGDPVACTFPGALLTCGDPVCDGTSMTVFVCNGAGACAAGESVNCAPFGCADGTCLTSCSDDADCAADHTCSAEGHCLPADAEDGCLADAVTLVRPDGTTESCAPFRCVNDACLTTCTTDGACAGNRRCENGTCVIDTYDGEAFTAPQFTAEGSFGCAVSRRASSSPLAALGASLALLLLAASRRRSASASRRSDG